MTNIPTPESIVFNPKARKIIIILCLVIFSLFLLIGVGAWFARKKINSADVLMAKKEVEITMLKTRIEESSKGYAVLYTKNETLKLDYAELEKKKQKTRNVYLETKSMLDTLPPTGQFNFLTTRLDSARKAGGWGYGKHQ